MTKELIVEVGKYYKTREAQVVYCAGESPWSPQGLKERFVMISKCHELYCVNIEGKWFPGQRNVKDLVSEVKPKQKLMGFINIYGSDNKVDWSDVHPTKKQAERYAVRERLACLDLGKYGIEFEEGEGL